MPTDYSKLPRNAFMCPKCGSSHFARDDEGCWCHDQFETGCRWSGPAEDCMSTSDGEMLELAEQRVEELEQRLAESQRGEEAQAKLRKLAEDFSEAFHTSAENAESKLAALRETLGNDHPWNVPSTLRRLSDAAEHLLDAHACDAHGYEEVSGSIQRGRDYATDIEIVLAAGENKASAL